MEVSALQFGCLETSLTSETSKPEIIKHQMLD